MDENPNSASPDETQAQKEVTRLKQVWAVRTPADLRHFRASNSTREHIVEGLIPSGSLNLLVGDSGLGKRPLLYQLCMCVAAGVPFLGHAVKQGPALYIDYENSVYESETLTDSVARFLEIPQPNDGSLLIENIMNGPSRWGEEGWTAEDLIRAVKPSLAVIDSWSQHCPKAERENAETGEQIKKLRGVIHDVGCAINLTHHRKKPQKLPDLQPPRLEDCSVREWFQEARGPSALVNGVDTRLGLDKLKTILRTKKDNQTELVETDALILRGFRRIRGEVGPIYVERVIGDDGEPLGYRAMTGAQLLYNETQEEAYGLLSEEFTFKDAKHTYGRRGQATRDFLAKCSAVGIVRKIGRGRYVKTGRQ